MPLGSAIGSGQGIHTAEEISIIIEQASIPVVVDAGLAVPSQASQAMEMGADAVLVNTAIARAQDPALMGEAFSSASKPGARPGSRAASSPSATPRPAARWKASSDQPREGPPLNNASPSTLPHPIVALVTDRDLAGGRTLSSTPSPRPSTTA